MPISSKQRGPKEKSVKSELGKHDASLKADGASSRLEELEAALLASRASEAKLRQGQRLARMATAVWDPVTMRLLSGAEAIATLVGVPAERLFNDEHGFFQLIHAEDRARFWSLYHSAARHLPGYYREYRLVRPDGSVIHLAENSVFERNEHGQAVSLLVAIQDVTARKTLENNLRRGKLQAEIGSHAKSQFLAHMSHELRTPLNAIIGFSDVMRRQIFGGIGNARYVTYIDHIHESGAHLLALINGVLDLAKIEAGKVRLEEEPVHFRDAVQSCVASLTLRAEAAQISLTVDIAEDWVILGDHVRLKQIMLNLLSNAVKFTSRGGTVRVGARRLANADLQIQVSDTGQGIREEDIGRALAPFEQLDSTYTRSHEGTGLGLPLARALTELHGGQLTLRSKVGVGTTVTLTFPASRLIPDKPIRIAAS